jgi:hypothetical protein
MKRALSSFLLVFLLPASGLTQERIKFPVGVSSKVLGYGHLWAAWRLKYFEREGLDVDVVLMRRHRSSCASHDRGIDLRGTCS